ncbi:unnamed protein product [Prunus armeniaca]|uniref:Fe2OG dioxygenase domain-containing protein n=1 Tax=Prunus armeniaca TaxID=36596 RepID=A0A6J5V6F1_PRUAR|nr:unnamed protein product [Prunus armeniaca]
MSSNPDMASVQELVKSDPSQVPGKFLKEELDKLDQACKEWGFFQVVNHGVAAEVLQEMKDATAKFFQLPLEEKNKIRMASGGFEGYGQVDGVTRGETMDWSDQLVLTLYPAQYRMLNSWPTEPEGYKEAIEAYSSEVKRVGEELLSPHSDASTITILMQEDNVTGLQIRKEGEWVPVKPIPNALVVNVGDAIEIWSNGKYKSIEHRAVANEGKLRISYASFLFPHVDVEVGPFDHMVESSRMYKKVKYGDYLTTALKNKLKGKAHTEMAKTGS